MLGGTKNAYKSYSQSWRLARVPAYTWSPFKRWDSVWEGVKFLGLCRNKLKAYIFLTQMLVNNWERAKIHIPGDQKETFSEIFTERCKMKGRSSILRKHIEKYTYQSIPQYQPWGAGTWSRDQPRSCAELSEKYILRSAYSTAAYNKNKSRLLKKNYNTVFRSMQGQEKVTALTIEGPEGKCSEKDLFIKLTNTAAMLRTPPSKSATPSPSDVKPPGHLPPSANPFPPKASGWPSVAWIV